MKGIAANHGIHRKFFTGSLVLTALIGASALAFAQDAKPQRMRAEAEALMRKAQELKARGSAEEAHRVAKEAEELMRAAGGFEKQRAQEGKSKEPADLERQEKIKHLRAELKELTAAGKMEQAAKVKQAIAELEHRPGPGTKADRFAEAKERIMWLRKEIEERHRLGRHEEAERLEQQAREMKEKIVAAEEKGEFRPDRPKFEGPEHAWMQKRPPGEPLPPPEEIERRHRHLIAAIENLHAAGMHEPAEHLTQQAEKFHRELREKREAGQHGPERPQANVQALLGEIKELRQAVQEIRRQLEELRQRR
ncbi:MAG: hypothetical protein HY735_31560 [Verrucomicrobia bacterium]|nr:hypothetical protein [Verrucomicrobiota bacterium]